MSCWIWTVLCHLASLTALMNVWTRISPHVWPHLVLNAASHVCANPHVWSAMCLRHASLSIIHTIECKRTTRTHLLHHAQNDYDFPRKSHVSSRVFSLAWTSHVQPATRHHNVWRGLRKILWSRACPSQTSMYNTWVYIPPPHARNGMKSDQPLIPSAPRRLGITQQFPLEPRFG